MSFVGQRILVMQLRQLGDILLTTPALRTLRKSYPQGQITFFSHAMGRLIAEDSPDVDEHFVYDDTMDLGEQITLLQNLRGRRFDLVVDFMNNPRSALATFCTRSPYRVAYRSARGWAYTDTSPKVERPDHVYVPEQKIALLKHFELAREPADPRRLILPWHEKHLAPTLKLQSLAALGDASRTLHGERLRVALSPTHRRPPRRWPVERYAALADVLTSQHGADVIWLWGPGEEDFVRDVARMCKEATWFAPKTSFRELAAVIANCDLFIGNSNGPSHVAVAVDTPSFQLHGPTSLRAWCPLTPEHQGIEASDLAALSVEQVLAALPFDVVRQHMAKRRKGGAFTLRLAWNQPR